tara:strand:+ start:58227 stop:58832 length:606 start_codon:yes stop_codon:yes gene_type:complete
MEKICERCYKKFKTPHRKQKFCGHSCATLSRIERGVKKRCEYCGKEFVSNIDLRKYCGDLCAKKAHREKSKRLVKTCEECNKEYRTEHKTQRFCSLRCAAARNSRLKLSVPTKNGKKKITVNKKRSYLSRYNAEQKINRKLRKGEVVHHIDCDPTNDNPDNLYVFKNNSIHISCHHDIDGLVKGLLEDNIIKFVDGRYTRV